MPSQPTEVSVVQRIVQQTMKKDARGQLEKFTIAIVEPGGALSLLIRGDSAHLASVEVAINKARTAASLRRPTSEWRITNEKDPFLVAALSRSIEGFAAIAGGLPVDLGHGSVWGLGVSGGHYSEDEAVAVSLLKGAGFDAPQTA